MFGDDDVARSIWNEQQRDAAPSPEEQERMKERAETIHVQYKAVERLIEERDWPFNYEVVVALADYVEYDELADLRRHQWEGGYRSPSFQARHRIAVEVEDQPSEARRQSRSPPPFDERYDVPSDPEQYDLIDVPDDVDVRSGRKILNPFGAKKARVVAIEDAVDTHVYTNETYEKAVDRDNWRTDRFDDETIERYQEELHDLHEHVVTGGDA